MSNNELITPDNKTKAIEWYNSHKKHVDKIVKTAKYKTIPSNEDEFQPMLWRAEHWNWFLFYFDSEKSQKQPYIK